MPRQHRGKAPRKKDLRATKRKGVCPICDRVLQQCCISVGGGVSVCPGCLEEYRRQNDPSEVRICAVCRESTATPYAIYSGGEVVCSDECDDAYLQDKDFAYGEDDEVRSQDRY